MSNICPKCGKEIDDLRYYTSSESSYNYYLDEGVEQYELDEFIPIEGTNEYECPECSEVLFKDADKAKEFLLGK